MDVKILGKVNKVVYSGSMFRNRRYDMDVERRFAAGNRLDAALAALMGR